MGQEDGISSKKTQGALFHLGRGRSRGRSSSGAWDAWGWRRWGKEAPAPSWTPALQAPPSRGPARPPGGGRGTAGKWAGPPHTATCTRGQPGSLGRGQGGPRTRDGVLGVELERVVHEGGHDGGGGPARGVGGQQRVVAVVDVRGLVEAQTPVPHGLVGCRLQELGEDEAGLVEHGAVEQPAQGGRRLAVHGEGDAPVVQLHRLVQVDAGRDCGRERSQRSGAAGRARPERRGPAGSRCWAQRHRSAAAQQLRGRGILKEIASKA